MGRITEPTLRPRISRFGIVISILFLTALVAFSLQHVGEVRRFALLAEHAEPQWLFLSVALQVGTYLCAGALWGRVVAAAGYRLPNTQLARLSLEQLSINQFVPTGGLSGNIIVINALARMGVPAAVTTEALLINLLSRYAAFAGVAAIALVVLRIHHDVTPVVIGLLGVFAVVIAGVPLLIWWLLKHREFQPHPRLARFRALVRVLDALEHVSVKRVRNPRLLLIATAFQASIFVLDAATLWTILHAIGAPAHPLTSFVAIAMATIAATLSFLPGGVGSFEAGSTATLALLGVPVEAALTSTLLFRGLSLWLPLVPGLILARGDIAAHAPTSARHGAAPVASVPLAALLEQLRATRAGLTATEAAARLVSTGPNVIGPKRARTVELIRSVASPLVLILLAAAAASAFLGELADAIIITTIVLLSGAINYWQASRSGRAVRSLQSRVTPTATALRDGKFATIARADVVVGDVIQLSAGDLVPADARLLESTDLHVHQAALTGESLPVEKRATEGPLEQMGPDAQELLFAGTSIVSGTASAVVFATGQQTEFGDIASRLAARPEETEFERGLRHFGMLILQTVTFLVLLILVVSIATGRDAFQSLLFAIALAVGLTPEYLPMITTVTLAQGAVRMARQKVIVKHLASIQNLGSIDILCSDKTGTLTSGKMTLDASLDPVGRPSERTLFLAYLNSTFETGVKSALDAAILEATVDVRDYRKVAEVPFDFERRRLSVVVQKGDAQLLITKGAPESVLGCSSNIEIDGRLHSIDEDDSRRKCFELFRKLSADGYRVLAVAYRDVSGNDRNGCNEERDLTLVGFLTFADQLLEGIEAAIANLRNDGVTVKILSGDNELVTRALCQKVGIDIGCIVTGGEIEHLDELTLARVAEDASIFARVSPAQKQRIVLALKRRGHVVGFMGDGINDAPSLHSADVGISVAGAVDVAQEASDILLLERRLDVLHAGIMTGRHAFANVLKYLLMGTSSNFGNILSMAGAVFFLPFLPMLPTQILVNNFLYDFAQLTIPTDNVDPAYLQGPQRWDIRVIRKFMLVIGPVSSLFDFLTFGILLLVFRFGESLFQTGWFIESLTTQVLVLFVIRTTGRPWTNRPSAALVLTIVAVVVTGIVLPHTPLAAPLGMTPLPAKFFLLLLLIVPSYLVLVECVKSKIVRRIFSRLAPSPR